MNEEQLEEKLLEATKNNLKATAKNIFFLVFTKNKNQILNDLCKHIDDIITHLLDDDTKDGKEYVDLYNLATDLTGLFL